MFDFCQLAMLVHIWHILLWGALLSISFSEHQAFFPTTKLGHEPSLGHAAGCFPNTARRGQHQAGQTVHSLCTCQQRQHEMRGLHLPPPWPSVPLPAAACSPQPPAGLCCIFWSRSCYSFGPLLSITTYSGMRLGNTEKFLSTKYLFLVGNNIRNRVNIWKAF